MANITVDGKTIEAKSGALLIDELLANDINIPHFCYHPALGKDGNCRMCMVEIEGQKRPQIACDTPVKDGMIIRTKGTNIDRVKRSMLELELINHPIDCPICDQAGECQLQNYYMDVGLYESRLSTPKTHGEKRVDLGANVVLDQERCVLCTRCVRFTQKITHTNELGVLKRADHSVIATFPDTPLSNPYAMNVVDLCPVGALTSKDFRFHKRVWFLKTQEAICNICARGCSIFVDHHREKYKDEAIYRYRPRFNALINGHFICDAGRMGYKQENEYAQSQPRIRGKISEYEYAEGKLLKLIKRHLSKTLMLVSSSLSLEEMVRLQKLCKVYGIALSGYGEQHCDDSFGDTFLKCNNLSSNERGLKVLQISSIQEDFEVGLREAQLVVFVGRNDVELIENKGYDKSITLLCSFGTKKEVELFLPIASHMHRAGSFINVDGFVQHSACAIELNHGTQSLIALLATILGDNIFTCKDIWDEELSLRELFSGINFEVLQNNTPRISL